MRALRYSINLTLDGCCDHRGIIPDEWLQELHRHHTRNMEEAGALLFGRTYGSSGGCAAPDSPPRRASCDSKRSHPGRSASGSVRSPLTYS